MSECPPRGTMDLGHAAQGISILHFLTVGMGGVDGAALQERPEVLSDRELSGVGTELV